MSPEEYEQAVNKIYDLVNKYGDDNVKIVYGEMIDVVADNEEQVMERLGLQLSCPLRYRMIYT